MPGDLVFDGYRRSSTRPTNNDNVIDTQDIDDEEKLLCGFGR